MKSRLRSSDQFELQAKVLCCSGQLLIGGKQGQAFSSRDGQVQGRRKELQFHQFANRRGRLSGDGRLGARAEWLGNVIGNDDAGVEIGHPGSITGLAPLANHRFAEGLASDLHGLSERSQIREPRGLALGWHQASHLLASPQDDDFLAASARSISALRLLRASRIVTCATASSCVQISCTQSHRALGTCAGSWLPAIRGS